MMRANAVGAGRGRHALFLSYRSKEPASFPSLRPSSLPSLPPRVRGRCDGRWRDVLLLRRRTGNGAISEGERDAGGQSAPPTQPCNFPGTIAAKRGSARSFHVPLRRGGPGWNGERASPSQVRERESSMAMRLGLGWAGNGRRMKTTLQASKLATCRRTSTITSSPKESVGGAASSCDHRVHGKHKKARSRPRRFLY